MSIGIWVGTLAVLAALIAFDLALAFSRRNRETSFVEALLWTIFYVTAAIIFGLFLPTFTSSQTQQEFFAGWLTEYALSVDNIFVFLIILTHLKIAKERQQLVLLLGILLTIAMRGLLIPTGAALISRFSSIFFLFGAFLIFTAYKLIAEEDEEWQEGKVIAHLKKRGLNNFTIALIALGLTNLVFSLDSIPAIFGLTQNAYVVTTANIFALMGLRQLFFLLEGLLSRLIHLSHGLSFILAFIGVKMILEAFHEIGVDDIGRVHIPVISLKLSLSVIIGTLIVITFTSLQSTRNRTTGE